MTTLRVLWTQLTRSLARIVHNIFPVKYMQRFLVSTPLAQRVLRAVDDTPANEEELESARLEMSDVWHGQMLSFANVLHGASGEGVLINGERQLNCDVLEIIRAVHGFPSAKFDKRGELLAAFIHEYYDWVARLGSVKYGWGALQFRNGSVIMTLWSQATTTLDELLARAGFPR